MQKTIEMIENTIKHLQRLLQDPESTPEMKRAVTSLISHLTEDLKIARSAAKQD